MKHHRAGDGERTLAVFIDFENLALGFAGRRDRFQIEKVLERLVEKGKIVAKKAYCDWSRFGAYAGSLHECAIELIEIPKRSLTGKNSADIRLVVDAVDLAYSKDHIDTFVIVSGDSDFSPLVSKLKELGKHVIGLGLVDATSNLLRDNCDEFIYYEDLDRPAIAPISESPLIPESKRKVFALLMDSLVALRRENKELIFSSMVKDTMKRKKPSFNEEYHGYRTFSDLLEDAQRFALIEIEKHKTSGTYVVTRFGQEMRGPAALPSAPVMSALPPRGGAYYPSPPAQAPVTAPLPLPPAQRPSAAPARPAPTVHQEPLEGDRRPPHRGGPFIPGQTPPSRPAPATPPPPPAPAKPVQRPAPPSAVPPAPIRRPLDEDDLPVLGRSLIEEVDGFDDDDDVVPSYAPGGPTRTPTRPKTPETVKKPAPAASKPKRPEPAGPPASKKPVTPSAKPTPPPAEAKRSSKHIVVPPPPPPPAPPPRPTTVDDEDGFSAGLDG
jgi:uncharacterized protein (TIGR00288 family)